MSLLVAVLSDTHIPSAVTGLPTRTLPPSIFSHLRYADLILHTGDIVEISVLEELAVYASVYAVRGNWDTHYSVTDLPETMELKLCGVSISMSHNSGQKPYRRSRMRKRFPNARAVLFGHSHKPGIDDEEGLLLLNPGSALSTFALLHLENGSIVGEIIDLRDGTRYLAGTLPPLSTKRSKRTVLEGVD